MATNSIKFTGMASGLDTESIVTAMVAPYKLKVDAAKGQQTLMEWKKDAYKEMNAKIYSFYTKYAGIARLESTFNKKIITSSSPNKVKIEAGGTVPEGTHTISNIKFLAQSARIQTNSIKTTDAKQVSKDTTLDKLGIANNTTITVGEGGDKTTITLTSDKTIGELESEIKKAMPNSSITFDTSASAFFISSKKTGASQQLTFEGSDDSVLFKLGIASADKQKTITKSGENAKFDYNGVTIESESNTVTVNGLKITLQAKTAENEVIDIQSSVDTESVVSYVKEFIEAYNTLIADINEKVSADSSRGYDPLTDEQKEAMSEDDIKAWEKKIKDSLFRNDETLKSLTTSMRNILGGNVKDNSFSSLASIGITTGDWTEKGKLYIDEDKLREAVNKDLDGVIGLFAGKGTEPGIADKLYEDLGKKFKTISGVKTSTSIFNDTLLDKNITSKKEDISTLEDRMTTMEDMYYARFTAMEKMLSQLNSQSSWLSQQLGG